MDSQHCEQTVKRLASLDWWKHRTVELVVALVISTGVVQVGGIVSWRQKELTPPNAWMTVREIYVPDFPADTRPDMIYDREIRENFNGYWIVEVQHKTDNGLWSTTCSGNGLNEYDPSEVIPNNTVSWPWFIGKDCAVEPGTYRLKVSYSMTRPNWPEKRLQAISNEFKVTAPEKS